MRVFHPILLGSIGVIVAAVGVWPQSPPSSASKAQGPAAASAPLVLVGGTVVDVSDWGRSAKDLPDAVVIVRDGRIVEVGNRLSVPLPKNARVVDCTGKYLIPGLVDGFAGMNSQGQANAFLAMGVTTVVAASDQRRGWVDFSASPIPHLYWMDSIGTTDNWSLLTRRPEWAAKLHEGARPAELTPEDTIRQLGDTARLGTRVLLLGHELTAANSQWIISRAHQMGLVTYGEFAATPYRVGIEAGVDALPHMGRYELGAIPEELQRPLVEDPEGGAAATAYDYSAHLPASDPQLHEYARFVAKHHTVLMPTFSLYFLQLPGHRNLWKEPAAGLLDPARMSQPPDRSSGELYYPLASWARHLPAPGQRYLEEGQRKKAEQLAMRLWQINESIFATAPHYLAASGAPVKGSMPGISMHIEMEMLVRLGLSPREALAAATNNYAVQFGWSELGQIVPGRRADIVVLDGDPTANIWNTRRISTILMDGNLVDRNALLNLKR